MSEYFMRILDGHVDVVAMATAACPASAEAVDQASSSRGGVH